MPIVLPAPVRFSMNTDWRSSRASVLADHAGDEIEPAAGRKRHDETDRPVRPILLRPRRLRPCGRGASKKAQRVGSRIPVASCPAPGVGGAHINARTTNFTAVRNASHTIRAQLQAEEPPAAIWLRTPPSLGSLGGSMNFSKAHFIGIAGKGMSATALLLKQMGVEISGSDEGFYPPVSDYLKSANVPFAKGYRKENIPADADVIVIGKNAKFVPETNEEVRAAFASGKLVRSFADIVHELTVASENIVVAGLVREIDLHRAARLVPADREERPELFHRRGHQRLRELRAARAGPGVRPRGRRIPVVELGQHLAKFLRYNARNVLLTSATHDHINVFPTHADFLKPFRALLDRPSGRWRAGRMQQRAARPRARSGDRPACDLLCAWTTRPTGTRTISRAAPEPIST